MIVSTYRVEDLGAAFGIEMSALPNFGPGAGWGRIAPGGAHTTQDQHDETEIVMILSGNGHIEVDGARADLAPGTVVSLAPFETHVLTNTGTDDLVFFDLYWRDPQRAAAAAAATVRRGFDHRPVFVFSTPPTPNGDLHLGHLSGPYLGADAYVRFQRMNGATAWHLTGSDDYQSYVVARAARDQQNPRQTAAHYSAEIAETLRLMDIAPDQYTVTSTDDSYAAGLQAFFARLVASGAVRRVTTPALVDPVSGEYLYEVDVSGGCPGCGVATSGNICEECGEPNICVDLIDATSNRSGLPAATADVERFSLPLGDFAELVATQQNSARVPARLRELAHRVFTHGAREVAMSHVADWGVRPPADGDGQVIWVWPEMAFGFLHGIQRLGERLGQPWAADQPGDDWKIVHFFGFDNSFYHSLLYPILYHHALPDWQADIDYHVNEFYLLSGQKFSTSRRHAVWGKDVLTPNTVDAIRFFLSATRPEDSRTNFDPADYTAMVRTTLIDSWQRWLNDLGERVETWYGGVAPDAGTWTAEHTAVLARLNCSLAAVGGSLGADGFSLSQAAAELDRIVVDIRRFAAREYAVADVDRWGSQTRTAVALELAAARLLAHAAAPVMPRFAARLAAQLGLDAPTQWPTVVELVPAGSIVALAGAEFFHAHEPQTEAVGV